MSTPATKRRYERFDCDIEIEAFHTGLASLLKRKNVGVRLVNMSECGIQFVAGDRLAKGQKLAIGVKIPRVPDRIEGTVVIHWCLANGKRVGEFLAGAEFVKMPDGTLTKIQQLRKLVRSAEYRKPVGGWVETKAPAQKKKPDEGGIEFVNNPRT